MKNKLIDKILNIDLDADFVKLADSNEWITYRELWSHASDYAKVLNEKKETEIGISLENGLELFTLYFAGMIANKKLIPVDPQKSDKEREKIFSNHSDIFVIDSVENLPSAGDKMLSDEEIKNYINEINLDKEFLVTYTSGSTGEAKGVRHTLKNLMWSAYSFGCSVKYDKLSICCHTMPMTYMAGILNTIIMPFLWGSKIVIYPRFTVMEALNFWKRTRDNAVNSFWLSPTMLNIIMTIDRSDEMKEYFNKNEVTFCVGTAPLFPNLKEQFENKYGVKLLQSYGLSETLFISTNTFDSNCKAESVGKIINDVDVVIKEDGEIITKVPWMYLGYQNENDESYFEGEYYITGDLGIVDDGSLFITGRKKDLIIRGGMNISPRQIEECLINNGLFSECCVTSVTRREEERIICWYVSKEIPEIINKANKIIVDELGSLYKVDRFIAINNLPKNLNGKIDKIALRNGYNDN